MSTIAAIVVVTLFGVLFAAMAIAPALIEAAASSSHSRPRLVIVEPPPVDEGDDGQSHAA